MDTLYAHHNVDLEEMTILMAKQALGFGVVLNAEYSVPEIDGWMTPIELLFLYHQARKMDSVVEIGSWKGRSTHALASACKGTVYACDHWLGSPNDITSTIIMTEDVYSTFVQNTKHFTNLQVLRGRASESVAQFADQSVDMVFIDGGHTFADVHQDITLWLPKTRKLICGHDYSQQFPEVVAAVHTHFGHPDGVWGTIWYKQLQHG